MHSGTGCSLDKNGGDTILQEQTERAASVLMPVCPIVLSGASLHASGQSVRLCGASSSVFPDTSGPYRFLPCHSRDNEGDVLQARKCACRTKKHLRAQPLKLL